MHIGPDHTVDSADTIWELSGKLSLHTVAFYVPTPFRTLHPHKESLWHRKKKKQRQQYIFQRYLWEYEMCLYFLLTEALFRYYLNVPHAQFFGGGEVGWGSGTWHQATPHTPCIFDSSINRSMNVYVHLLCMCSMSNCKFKLPWATQLWVDRAGSKCDR